MAGAPMTGIHDLFAEFSQPDEFHVQAQLELFAWYRKQPNRQRFAPKVRKYRRTYAARPDVLAARRESNRRWMARKRADVAWRAQERSVETARRRTARAESRAA
jgi:hypothetical protein